MPVKTTTKDVQKDIVSNMKQWQKIENASVASTGKIIQKTDNPIIRIVMEIIQNDSQMHYRVQKLIAESLEGEAVTLTPEDVRDAWSLIEKHIELEKKTVELAEAALKALKGRKMVVQEYLINYLLEDENKHNHILESLGILKKGLYPYG